jgi:hypothetical protein
MGNSEGWDYTPDLGKKATEDVDDVVGTEEETPDFGFDMDDAEDEDISGERAMDEPEAKPTKEPVKKTVTDDTADPANKLEVDKAAEQVLKYVGGDTLVRIKGTERPLKDFSPQEIVNWIQKSARADQVMQEAAASRRQLDTERRQLEEHRALLEKGAAMVQDQLGGKKDGESQAGNVPDFLKPGQFDTEEVTALKQFSMQQQQRLDRLEGSFTQRQKTDQLRGIQQEVENLKKDFPMASLDEVLAVKLAHPEASSAELMEMAHKYYCSQEHIDAAFKSNPTYKREYDESVIKQYIARKQSAKKIAGQPVAANSSSSKVTEKGKVPIRSFEDATKASHAYLRESRRIADEN